MTEHPQDSYEDQGLPAEGGRRRKRRSVPGCLAVLIALAVVAGGFYFVVTKGVDAISDKFFSSAEDFEGPGQGKVTFEVVEGDVVAQICRNLKKKGVVASVDACIEAANATPDSSGIQVGIVPDEEGDGGRGRDRHPGRPGQHHPQQRDRPRGAARGRDRGDPRREQRVPRRGLREGARRPVQDRVARLRRGQPRGLPLPLHLRLRQEGDARQHADRDGGPVGAGDGGRRPRGGRRRVSVSRRPS